jgi:hypothetical protein
MSVEFTCNRCQQPRNGFWDSPPTCNRCLIQAVIEDAIWTELERQAETERFGAWVDREQGTVDGSGIDMGKVADAVLNVFDNAHENGHDSDIREYLTQTGWR